MKSIERRTVRLGLGVLGGMLLNTAVINSFPFLAGALTDQWRIDPMRVGLLITIELSIYALVAIGLSGPTLNLKPRRLGLLGCACFALGNLLATTADTYASLVITRSVAGLGGGLAAAAVGRAIAFSDMPAHLMSYIGVPLSIASALFAMGAGSTVISHGYTGGCLYLAGVSGLAALLSAFLPTHSVRVVSGRIDDPNRNQGRRGAPLVLAAGALLFVGSGSVWSFSERIGLTTGLSADQVTSAIGLSALVGVAGAFAAGAAARLRQDFLAAAMGALMFGFSVCALALAESPSSYVTALCVLSFAFIFIAPFLAAMAIRIDGSGGLVGAMQGAQMLASALAPFLGGLLLTVGSVQALAVFAAGASAIAVLCIGVAHAQPTALTRSRRRPSYL